MMQIDNLEEAKESFEKIIALDEKDDSAHASLANVLHKLGDNAGAMIHHDRAIVLDPEYAPYYFNYANTLYDLGEKEKALARYERAYELDSSLEEAYHMIQKFRITSYNVCYTKLLRHLNRWRRLPGVRGRQETAGGRGTRGAFQKGLCDVLRSIEQGFSTFHLENARECGQ